MFENVFFVSIEFFKPVIDHQSTRIFMSHIVKLESKKIKYKNQIQICKEKVIYTSVVYFLPLEDLPTVKFQEKEKMIFFSIIENNTRTKKVGM